MNEAFPLDIVDYGTALLSASTTRSRCTSQVRTSVCKYYSACYLCDFEYVCCMLNMHGITSGCLLRTVSYIYLFALLCALQDELVGVARRALRTRSSLSWTRHTRVR